MGLKMFFKRKKKPKKELGPSVILPVKKRRSKKKNRRNFKQLSNIKKTILFVFVLVLFFLLVGGFLFLAFNIIHSLKSSVTKKTKIEYISELENIPAYPESYSVFNDVKDKKTILPLQIEGILVYKRPSGVNSNEIYNYYKDLLPKRGWTFIKFVPYDTENAKLGQYWFKDKIGLQIVVDEQYIWYRKLTLKQAKTLLQDEAKADALKRKIVLSSADQVLLPDFPWKLTIPGDYIIRYKSSNLDSWRTLLIKDPAKDDTVVLEPIAKFDGKPFEDYVDQWIRSEHHEWEIISTNADSIKGKSCIRVTISSQESDNIIAIVWLNTKNSIVYALYDEKGNTDLFKFVSTNIKQAPKTRNDPH